MPSIQSGIYNDHFHIVAPTEHQTQSIHGRHTNQTNAEQFRVCGNVYCQDQNTSAQASAVSREANCYCARWTPSFYQLPSSEAN